MDTLWLDLALIAAAILANGFFAGSEIALVSARRARLAQLRASGVAGAGRALALKDDPETFLATIQIAITLVGTLAGAVGGAAAIEAVTPWLERLPLPGATRWGQPLALAGAILAITYVSLVLGELVPKSLALRNPERLATVLAGPIERIARVTAWPNRLLTASTRAVLTLLGQRGTPSAPLVSEDEVKFLVREGTAHGVFEHAEAELIHRVLRFTDTTVRTIMVPRPKILALDVRTPSHEVLSRVAQIDHARVPVYRETIDQIVGVVIMRDLLRCAVDGTPPVLERLVHPPLFVPETARVPEVLREFQRRRQNLALVVDEHGRVQGLVTMEDLLEDIVGDIPDEGEPPELGSVTRLPGGALVIDGAASIRDLRDRAGLPIEESPHYQTIAGFVLHRLGAVPQPGASVSAFGYTWTVVDVDGPRIVKVKAERQA